MEIKRAKGTRDFFYEDELLRKNVLTLLEETFRLYGFNPLETPILELYETLASKYSGGAEIIKETFTLKDQGKRDLGLRYDLTVPFARFIAMNPQFKMPVKRYQIGPVFRDGPLKVGRYREFYQCDVDVVGMKNVEADAEILTLAERAFQRLKMDVVIKVNNRKILDALMIKLGVPQTKCEDVMLSLDKLEKIGLEGVQEELKQKGITTTTLPTLFESVLREGTNQDKLQYFWKLLGECEGLDEIEKVLALTGKNVEFDPCLARGLSYYTGTVFEVYLRDKSITSSVAAGGRYDKMICEFVGKEGYEAVGISFGLDVICDALRMKGQGTTKSVCQAYIIPIQALNEGLSIAERLRDKGVACDIDLQGRGISKNLEYASVMKIPYVVFVGQKELAVKKVKVRNMISGKEELLSVEEATQMILH
ncbi:MAG: histidine--tRNA ligase [Nanoarchaeota archaeon]